MSSFHAILKYPVPSLSSSALGKTRGQFPSVSWLLHHHMVPKIEGPCHIWVEGMLCLPLEVRMAKCRVDGRTPQACSLQEASPSSYLLRPLQLLLSPLLLLLTTTTTTFAQGWLVHSCQQICGWGPYQATWAPSTHGVRGLNMTRFTKK